MKGSEKFWYTIGAIFAIYINYLSLFSGVVYPTDSMLMGIAAVFTLLIDGAVVFFLIVNFIPKLNNWLDEKL